MQDSLNESSVRPDDTPVMPLLRSREKKFLKFVFEIWALRTSCNNDFPMFRAKLKSKKFFKFFWLKNDP